MPSMDSNLLTKLRELATDETFLTPYARTRRRDDYAEELISFTIGGELYGVDIADAREIIRMRPITSVPRVPPFVLGVVTVRGQIVPVLDLRYRLGLGPSEIRPEHRILQCEHDGERYGLLVDSVRSVVRLTSEQVEVSPNRGTDSDFVRALGRLDTELIALLDVAEVVKFEVGGED
jgi:purine-binding chemotaxis protein CheW